MVFITLYLSDSDVSVRACVIYVDIISLEYFIAVFCYDK